MRRLFFKVLCFLRIYRRVTAPVIPWELLPFEFNVEWFAAVGEGDYLVHLFRSHERIIGPHGALLRGSAARSRLTS